MRILVYRSALITRVAPSIATLSMIGACRGPAGAGSGAIIGVPRAMCFGSARVQASVRDHALYLAMSADPGVARLRGRVGLPQVDSSAVTLVSDESLCRRAAEAQRSTLPESQRGALVPVVLVRVGTTRFIAYDGGTEGEFRAYSVYDESFAHRGIITG